MRRAKDYLIYLFVELAVIPAVILIFKLNEDRQVAALQAGLLFIIIPSGILLREMRKKEKSWLLIAGQAQFLLLFALPIMGLRLFNWGVPFSELTLLGLSGQKIHSLSNGGYILMLVLTLAGWWRSRKFS